MTIHITRNGKKPKETENTASDIVIVKAGKEGHMTFCLLSDKVTSKYNVVCKMCLFLYNVVVVDVMSTE